MKKTFITLLLVITTQFVFSQLFSHKKTDFYKDFNKFLDNCIECNLVYIQNRDYEKERRRNIKYNPITYYYHLGLIYEYSASRTTNNVQMSMLYYSTALVVAEKTMGFYNRDDTNLLNGMLDKECKNCKYITNETIIPFLKAKLKDIDSAYNEIIKSKKKLESDYKKDIEIIKAQKGVLNDSIIELSKDRAKGDSIKNININDTSSIHRALNDIDDLIANRKGDDDEHLGYSRKIVNQTNFIETNSYTLGQYCSKEIKKGVYLVAKALLTQIDKIPPEGKKRIIAKFFITGKADGYGFQNVVGKYSGKEKFNLEYNLKRFNKDSSIIV